MKIKSGRDYGKVFSVAVAAAICIILPIIIANNGNLYLIGDYMTQQIPFIRECRRMLRTGAPFWSSNTLFGANFLGSYAFYNYGSPFYWPLYILPESLTGIGLSVTFVIRHGVAALTSYMYLKRYSKNHHLVFIGALIYTFSAFTMDATYYLHFIDVIAVFPLLLYLTDEALENRKKVLFALAVMLNAMINYYFFFSTSVFFLIYLVFKALPDGKKHTVKDAARCVGYYALGGIASMIILLPAAMTLLETYKATNSFSGIISRGLGNIPQVIILLINTVLPSDGIMGSAVGFNYSEFNSNVAFTPFFGAVFLFIALKKKKPSEWYFRLMKFLFVLTLLPFANGIFCFFTNLSYTRWWYAFVLISVLASIKIIEEKPTADELKKSAKNITVISASILGGLLAVKILFAYILKNLQFGFLPEAAVNYLKNTGLLSEFTAEDLRYFITLVLMTCATYIPLWLFFRKGKTFDAKKALPVVAIICIFSYSLYLVNETNLTANRNDAYKGSDIAVSEEVSYTSRTNYNYSFANYPAIANEPGITAFHSLKSHSSAEFCRLAGYANTLHSFDKRYSDSPAIQTVLSIEKLVDPKGNARKAPYYSPFGYSYAYYVLDEGFDYTTDKEENNRRLELMTKACIVDKETAEKISGVAQLLTDTGSINLENTCRENNKTAASNFVITSEGFTATSIGDKERLIYFSIPHDRGWSAYVNGEEKEILTLNGGMMGIIVPEGESEIEFIFRTPGLSAGIIISASSLIILGILAIIELKKRKRINR